MIHSESLMAAMNRQVGYEMGASMQYISVASYFATESLDELARFFYRQADEERDHAMKFVHFLADAGATLEIPEVPAPRTGLGSAEECVALALAHEEKVTRQIYDLVEIAREDKNYIALRFLDWFVDEQFEEVTLMGSLLQVVRRAGEENLLAVEEYISREGLGVEGAEEG